MHHAQRRALVRSLQQAAITIGIRTNAVSSTAQFAQQRLISFSPALLAAQRSPRDFSTPAVSRAGRTSTAANGSSSNASRHPQRSDTAVRTETPALHRDWKLAVAEFQRQQSPPQPAAVHALVALCVANDRHREAQDVVRRAQQLGVEVPLRSHALVCAAVAKRGDMDRALAMLDELQRAHGTAFSVEVYDPLLSVLKAQSDWRATHRVVQHMHAHKLQPSLRALRVLMLAAASARQRDTLLATIAFVDTQYPHARRDVATLTATCQALVSIGEPARVLALYTASDAAWLETHANTLLFNNFLLAAVRHDTALDRARSMLAQMTRSAHAQPDAFSYATCMLELEKRGDAAGVLTLYNDMQQRDVQRLGGGGDSASSSASSSPPSVVNALACAAVVRALHATLSESPRALKRDLAVVLKQLAVVDVSHLGHASSLIDTLDELRLYTAARQVFERLVRERVLAADSWLRKGGYELDLHTFSRGVAKCAVVHAFEAIKQRVEHELAAAAGASEPAAPHDLRIITGVGKHSKQFLAPVIRDEVTRMFAQSFRPPIWPARHPTNDGVLVVRNKALRTWVRKDGVVRYF